MPSTFFAELPAASGVALATGSSVTGVGVAVGAGLVAFGLANVSRRAQQIAEAFSGESEPSFKNVLGLAPFGQKFDDVNEPGPVEFAKANWEGFAGAPVRALVQAVRDFFAVEQR